MMLAENELEKINARTKLFEDIEQFSDADNLSDWATNLEGSAAEAYNSFSIDDSLREAANNEGHPLDSSLVARCQPVERRPIRAVFHHLSAEAVPSSHRPLTRSNVEASTKTRELTGTWNDAKYSCWH